MRNDLRFDFLASLTLAGAAVAALSACSTLTPTVQQADRATADAVARVAQMRERAEPARVEPAQTRQQIQESWVSAPVAPAKLVKRPAQLDAPITINAARPLAVLDAVARIRVLTGLDIQLAPDVMLKPQIPFGASFNGTVEELLARLCTNNRLAMKIEGGNVTLYRYETAVFRVKRKPGALSTTTQIGVTGGGSAGGTGARSGGEMSAAIQGQAVFDPWTDLTKKIKAMLTPDGKIQESPSSSSIVVTDVPEVVERARQAIEDDNKLAATPISVKIEVLSVTTVDDQNLGVNWHAVFTAMKSGNPYVALRFASPTSMANGNGGSFSVQVPPGSTSRFANSDFLIDALSKVATTRTLLRRDFTSLHNVPSGFSRTNSKTYRARVTPSPASSTSSGGTVGVEPGQINTGVRFIVTPTYLGDGEYSIELNYNDSFLREIVSLGDGAQQIDAPDVDGNQLFNVTALKMGETSILNAYEVDATDSAIQGLTSAITTAKRGNATKQRIYILVTVTGGPQ